MRRSRTPSLVAAATAIVSCGLLAVAIWQGWLGPDAGRGAGFCEAARQGLIKQPANTFSNTGFVAAGLLAAWHAGRPGNVGPILSSRRALPTVMACVIVLLGPASAAMHATQSSLGGHLDMLSMYLIAALAVAYAIMRFLRAGTATFAVVFVVAVGACELVEAGGGHLPVVMTAANAAFGALLLVAMVLELLIMRRGQTRSRRVFGFASVGTLLVAFGIWNATNHGMCQPYSPVQGHAAWHLLDAVAAYLLYRYYASEAPILAAGEQASADVVEVGGSTRLD
ncbi:MAG TPA: ceramidase domain-containing protein [Micromonosporaceae bacterium]|jgi:hypothetical protein